MKKVYAMVENEKVLLGEIKWVGMCGEHTTPNFKQVMALENCTVILTRWEYVDVDDYVASWEIYTNKGKVYNYYTDFNFKKVGDGTKENGYIVQYANELILLEM